MIIYKFGGTSVGMPERMHKVANLITKDDEVKIVVLSAISGTTNKLVDIGTLLLNKKNNEANVEIDELKKQYDEFVNKLYNTDGGKHDGKSITQTFFKDIYALSSIPDFNDGNYKTLLAFGEILSTYLFQRYLEEINIKSKLLSALDFMSIDQSGEPEIDHMKSKLTKILKKETGYDIYVTQGFICKNHLGKTDNLKRGGSDYTASLIGAAIKAQEVQIWTDIDGMHNNDPRIIKDTYPIGVLSFEEAAELAYFGAKILHPSSILPAQKYGIPVKLKSTMNEDAPGTVITNKTEDKDIKAIAAKDGITAIKILSTRMLLAHGFLRRLFEVFEKYETPIDMITTSEVAVSVTIDDDKHLKKIVDELKRFGNVEVDTHKTIVCIVGSMVSEKRGVVKRIFNALSDIPVRMVSYGGSRNNISILINTSDKEQALVNLNKGLFES